MRQDQTVRLLFLNKAVNSMFTIPTVIVFKKGRCKLPFKRKILYNLRYICRILIYSSTH